MRLAASCGRWSAMISEGAQSLSRSRPGNPLHGFGTDYDLDRAVDLALEVQDLGIQSLLYTGQSLQDQKAGESMLSRLAVCQRSPYRDIAFFQHYRLKRGVKMLNYKEIPAMTDLLTLRLGGLDQLYQQPNYREKTVNAGLAIGRL